jgi:signal peptidase I
VKPEAFDWEDAFHPSEPPPPESKRKTFVAEAKGALITLIVAVPLIFILQFAFQNYLVESSSMAPSYKSGDHVTSTGVRLGSFPPFGSPGRGDIVVYQLPSYPKHHHLMRIIGLPGDRVRINEGVVILNGKVLDEPYVDNKSHESIAERVIAANSYFMLGDNRVESQDSRTWGDLPREQVVSKVWFTYWRDSWSLY